jgi:hypothetical protein
VGKEPVVTLKLMTGEEVFSLTLSALAVEYAREHLGFMRPHADFRLFLNDEEIPQPFADFGPHTEIDPRFGEQDTADFVHDLAERLRHVPLPKRLDNEGHLEQILVPHVREFIRRRLGYSEPALSDAVIHHGHPKYAATRPERIVEILGAAMTGDIFIRRQDGVGTVFIELKLTKRSLPSGLQRAIGQSLVLRLKHNVICMVVHEGLLSAKDDTFDYLEAELWRRFKIALIVRSATG